MRFVEGNITEEEMRQYWEDPSLPLFEYEFVSRKKGKEEKILCRCYGLTERFKESLLEAMEDVEWDRVSGDELQEEIDSCFRQGDKAGLYNAEYFILTDEQDRPFGLTGISTVDIRGGAGLKTRDLLDLDKHYLAIYEGWYGIRKDYKGKGVGDFLLDWTEKMSKSRGVAIM